MKEQYLLYFTIGYMIMTQIAKFMGPTNMGPTWVLSAPDGPHIGPMNLIIRGSTEPCWLCQSYAWVCKEHQYPELNQYSAEPNYQTWDNQGGPGSCLTNKSWAKNAILMKKNLILLIKIKDYHFEPYFWTCHDNRAVVACTKLWLKWIAKI